MDMIISFLIGLFIGCGVMFFIYRNNNKRIEKLEKAFRG